MPEMPLYLQWSPLETTTVQKQRAELELLVAELRDRDRELNEMVSSHQKQLLSWEMDRQIVLNLSQKCANLQGKTFASPRENTILV